MDIIATPSEALQSWLEAHDLGQYFAAMAAEDITLDELADLDDADLKELGFSIGHRKQLRRALSETEAGPVDTPMPEGQRRQLTVLFCDLAGSTHLANTYDAEDMAAVLHRYHSRCYQIIEAWGGRPLGTQGDGVIACFGLPYAQENDAERCVRAALEMSEAIRALEFEDGLKLRSRIGVATGRLYVRGAVEEPGNVVGDTLNLAARLQDVAAYDTVVLSASTRRLVAKAARLGALGLHDLKGFSDPVELWTVEGMVDIADRLQATHLGPGQGLVGREHEVAQLQALWEEAKAGRGQVVVISGDAGIGKTFLLDAVRGFTQPDPHVHIRYFSAPFYENSALFPVIAQLNHAAGIVAGDGVDARLIKLKQMLPDEEPKVMRLFADLMSIDATNAWPPLDMTAAQQKQETFAALLAQLRRHAEKRPVLILAEDAHWADPTSLDFLNRIVAEVVPNEQVMLVVTHRPNVDMGWSAGEHLHLMPLERLSRSESREIVQRIIGEQPCPAELMHDIIENADGVPLFVAELARTAAEQLRTQGARSVKLPSSLEDSLRSRLDRLTRGKGVIQTAAVFGRRFYLSMLRPLMQMDARAMTAAVREPMQADIIVPIDGGASEAMLFRHALVQQAAYEGLLRTQRKELHARIAELLLEHQPQLAETEPETLARHFAGSEQHAEAIKYLIAAGQRATSRAAQVEATNHYLAALELLEQLPASPERDGQEVMLQALLGGALMATRGFAAPDVYDAFARARALCLKLGDDPMYCACLYGLLTVNASRSNKSETVELAREMIDRFGEAPVPSWSIAAHFASGFVHFFQGEMAEAEAHFETAVDRYTDDQHGPLVEQFGDNLAEFSLCYLQWLNLQQGKLVRSKRHLARAERMANELNNKNAQTRTFAFRMGRVQEMGDIPATAEIAPQVISISMTQGYPYWATAGQIGLGWVTALSGDPEGIKMIDAGLGFFDMIGQKMPQAYWRTYLVTGLIAAGDRARAIQAADDALAMSAAGLDHFYDAVLLRQKGEALRMAPGDDAAAEACFEKALDIAKSSGLCLQGLGAATAFAHLCHDQGRGAEARGVLEEAIASIEADGNFPVLTAAKEALARLPEA